MGGWSPGPSILEGADWGRRVTSCRSLGPPEWCCPSGSLRLGSGDEQASLLKVVQGVVLPVGLEVPGQGLLLLAELGGHLLVHVREEQAGVGLRLPLRLLKGLHHLGEVGQ